MNKLISKFQKNSQQEVRASLVEYKNKKLLDIRVFYLENLENKFKPTKKGIAIRIEQFPELKKMIEKVERAINKELKKEEK